jgi:glycosyltransferase involved in cell wall biosynthesis
VRVVEAPDISMGILRSGWDPWDVFKRYIYLTDKTCDIVHCVDTRPAVILPALWAHEKMGAKLITYWADWFGRGGVSSERPGVPEIVKNLFSPIETYFEENFRKYANGTVVISTQLLFRAQKLGLSKKSMVLIRPGCDIESLQPLDKIDCRRKLGLDERTPIVGFLGALTPRDGDLLLKSMEHLRANLPAAKLLLIGNHRLSLTEEQIRLANITETSFIPFQEISCYLSACDTLVLPLANTLANQARWPSKINDYLATGRPIVATATGDITEIISKHQVGLVVSHEPEVFANALLSVLSNTQKGLELGRNARKLAEGELSWSRSINSLLNFYEIILSST